MNLKWQMTKHLKLLTTAVGVSEFIFESTNTPFKELSSTIVACTSLFFIIEDLFCLPSWGLPRCSHTRYSNIQIGYNKEIEEFRLSQGNGTVIFTNLEEIVPYSKRLTLKATSGIMTRNVTHNFRHIIANVNLRETVCCPLHQNGIPYFNQLHIFKEK